MADLNRERLTQFLASVDQEIANMQVGEGRFRPGAIHFEKDKSHPVLHRLERFKENPTKENLNSFLEIAKQDFGAATAKAFKEWSHSIFPAEKVSHEMPAPKAFEVAVKDGFYDMFRAAQIPLSPKQVELLERHALTLARQFDQKITAVIRSQLKALVEKANINKDEE